MPKWAKVGGATEVVGSKQKEFKLRLVKFTENVTEIVGSGGYNLALKAAKLAFRHSNNRMEITKEKAKFV